MNFRKIRPLAVALGLSLGGTALAAEPTGGNQPTTTANQKLAETVANRLTGIAATQQADVGISCVNGVVTLMGTATEDAHKQAIIERVRTTPGVKQVRDGIRVSQVVPVQAQGNGAVGPVASPVPMGIMPAQNGMNGGPVVEPAPLGGVGMEGPVGASPHAPPLPPYAWPTYAPHNNLSRVAYPETYPYNAFPYIGPFYPFPKVPPGWRSVKLEWEDGHWWMGRTSTPHDYWRVRFW